MYIAQGEKGIANYSSLVTSASILVSDNFAKDGTG